MLLRIGQVLNTKGLEGEIKVVFFYSNFVVKEIDVLFFEKDGNILGQHKVLCSKKYKIDKEGRSIYILKLEEIEDIKKSNILVKSFIGKDVSVLPENIFIVSELKKCVLYNAENNVVGKIVGVTQVKKGYSLLIVKKDNEEEIFVPFIKEVVSLIDTSSEKVVLRNVDGILEQ